MPKNGGAIIFLLIAAICLPLILAPGCLDTRGVVSALGSQSKPYQEFLEDPVCLTTIKSVAIFPFADRAPQPGFDASDFGNKLANQLSALGKIRVIYPQDILDEVERENQLARRHNARLKERLSLGLFDPEKDGEATAADGEAARRGYYDPIKNTDEAIRLARRAKADAIIVGEVSDYDPYMRPRLSLTMRLIATGATENAAQAIAELTQWGIPRQTSGNASGGGVVYIRQQTFDSTIGSVGMDVSKYGRTHIISNHPYDAEVFVQSMGHYYDVIAHDLAMAFGDARKKAVKEAEDRAKTRAKEQNADQDKAAQRLAMLMQRDSRIPDHETSQHTEDWFDQAFPKKQAVLAKNNGDKRIQSWRSGGPGRWPSAAERNARDAAVPENERGKGLEGYSTMVDAAFPDADAMMELNMGDNRDRSWRPDYYNHANPKKSAPLYEANQFAGKDGE